MESMLMERWIEETLLDVNSSMQWRMGNTLRRLSVDYEVHRKSNKLLQKKHNVYTFNDILQ